MWFEIDTESMEFLDCFDMLLETERTPNDFFVLAGLGFKNYCFCSGSPICKDMEELLDILADYPRESIEEFKLLLPVYCLIKSFVPILFSKSPDSSLLLEIPNS